MSEKVGQKCRASIKMLPSNKTEKKLGRRIEYWNEEYNRIIQLQAIMLETAILIPPNEGRGPSKASQMKINERKCINFIYIKEIKCNVVCWQPYNSSTQQEINQIQRIMERRINAKATHGIGEKGMKRKPRRKCKESKTTTETMATCTTQTGSGMLQNTMVSYREKRGSGYMVCMA